MDLYFRLLKNINSFVSLIVVSGIFVATSLFFSSDIWAQQAIISLEPKEILIGQQASLRIRIELPAKASLVYPAISDTITRHIEIVSYGRPDTLLVDGVPLVLEQLHRITSWEAGFHPIPPLDFLAISGNDTLIFKSEALLLEVKAVEVDAESDIKDIKSIFSIPLSFRELLPYLLGLLLLLAIVWMVVRYIKKPKVEKQKPDIWEKPDIPAHMAAFSALSSLKNKKLWQKGEYKAYHSDLANILRFYIEKRYGVNAMELTTNETVIMVESYVNDPVNLNNLSQILEVADLVKFAKFIPEPSINDSSMELAFDFVDVTKKIVKDA